ncbi:MAG: hypothetical protein D8M59_15970 [Planctomycetes bacterium]|nr:hypothetical protein [Planctomycetota bacterium]NOG52764.1 hypothetical protein [Planctomycetota bacterium]
MNDRNDNQNLEIPPDLQHHLQEADRPDFTVPQEVDAFLHTRAAQHIAARTTRRRHRLRIWLPTGLTGAAAAIILMSVYLGPWWQSVNRSRATQTAGLNLDDPTILEAFALARLLKDSNDVPAPEWDYNADGLIDSHDVDALAAAAVHLENGI